MATLTLVKDAELPEKTERIGPAGPRLAYVSFQDPVGPDESSDPTLILTHRALARLLTIATQTGSRFERENVTVDPLAWIYAPRRIFEDQAAVDACQSHPAFLRGILLHGLSLGLDAEPAMLDEILSDGRDDRDLIVTPEGSYTG